MTKRNIKVATIVVSYNSYKSGFFPACLEHLRSVKTEDENFEIDHQIIVVDSASPDNTPERVRSDFNRIQVIESCENLGYAGGNNAGIKIALSMGVDYIAVVTHDVNVQDDWLLESVKAANSDSKIGVLQPLLLLQDEPNLINSTGNHIHFLGYGYAGDYKLSRDQYLNEKLVDVPYFSGAVVLFSAEAIRKVGDFDDEMWMYNEDQDLGWRMWLQGYRNVMSPKAVAFHKYEFSRSITKMFYMDRNRLINVFQNYHLLTIMLLAPAIFLNELAGVLLSLAGGWFKEKLKVWRYFLRPSSWRLIRRKRRLRQKNRTAREKYIVRKFTGKILFQDVENWVVTYIANPLLSAYWFILKKIIWW